MERLARCLIYLAAWGLLCFPLGRLFKRMPLDWDRPPFAEAAWERGGAAYERLGIRRWKGLAPDVSRFFPGVVPRKAIAGVASADGMRDMLRETCVAELTHWLLCLTGLALIPLWPGPGGIALYLVYLMLGNLPFIIIQRYNRPCFRRLLERAERRERRRVDAGADTFEQ